MLFIFMYKKGVAKMKKIILFIVFITLLMVPITVYSDDSFIEVNVEGNIKTGENIDIIIKSENIDSVYGASIGLIYDPELIKINSIIGGDFVSNNENIIEVENEVCKNGNQAGYTFTFIGDNEGVSGSFNIATINAKILNVGNLKLNEENIDIKIAQRNGDSINEYNCPLVGIDLNIKDDSIKEVIIQTEDAKSDENSIDIQDSYDKEIGRAHV